ncbi:MAG: serine hydrolase [Desulfobacterales bacterium]|jgi:CubicO group peptidase (beta-lactamase class C family)
MNENMESVNNLMKQAISNEVFPGGVLLVSTAGSEVFFQAYGYANIFSGRLMTRDTVFDLASFTKPLATTLSIIKLISQQKLELSQRLGSILIPFNRTDKGRISIENLLYHNSGFPDYRPYYKVLCKLEPNLRKDALRELLVKEPLINPPGKRVKYSDIGFMILCWVIEQVTGNPLDRFVMKEIYYPLGLENLFFVDLNSTPRHVKFAATEFCSWRNILLEGVVHDDNAFVVGGIQGHAGLFGTAQDVLSLLSELMAAYLGSPCTGVFDTDLIQMFFKQQEHTGRALGFDTPSSTDPSCGQYFSKDTVGHLGFTGTSFWMDLDRNVMIILLTNRVHPSRSNTKIKAFRPKLHDRVMKELINNGFI